MSNQSSADRQSPEALIGEVNTLAAHAKANHRLGESYIIESNAKLIESNARVEDETTRLIKKLQEFNQKSDRQADVMIKLTWFIALLTLMMLIGVVAQIVRG